MFLGADPVIAGVAEPAPDSAKPPPVAVPDFPKPAGDPAAIARGKQVFSVNCAFCHGSDARGGEGGPNLLRSLIVLNDQKGELMATIGLTGRIDQGMPKLASNAQLLEKVKLRRSSSTR